MEQFGLLIDSDDTVNPPAVTGFLDELRALQAPLVAKRDKELEFLTTIQPQDVTVAAFEAWTSRVEAIQERVQILMTHKLCAITYGPKFIFGAVILELIKGGN